MAEDEKLRLIDDARAIALRFVRENGQWERVGPINILLGRRDQLAVAYRTPFQKVFEEKERTNYWLPLVGKANLPYSLDIWYDNYKVMSIKWDEIGTLAVVSYKPGEWEKTLKGLASSKEPEVRKTLTREMQSCTQTARLVAVELARQVGRE